MKSVMLSRTHQTRYVFEFFDTEELNVKFLLMMGTESEVSSSYYYYCHCYYYFVVVVGWRLKREQRGNESRNISVFPSPSYATLYYLSPFLGQKLPFTFFGTIKLWLSL